ncbi:cytochrome P450, partial [Melanogaster broomeanus]
LVLHPEVQAKSQAEINTVVGQGLVPTFEDKERLAHLQAVICETMRCNPVAPLGHGFVVRSHYTANIILGPTIPSCQLTGRNFPDPPHFDPDHFILPDGQLYPQAKQSSFELVRNRICSGRFLADNAVWVAVATILSTLRIDKATEDLGNKIEVEPVFTPVPESEFRLSSET